MVHHAMRKLYGDNCYFADNSWKRYQRMNTGDTLIFNFGNTCCGGGYSYGGCCGGGSFWGGFGAGVGMGIANLFSGFMGGFMSMPFMNMWGGGMFGGGLWGSGLWGGTQSVSPWGDGGAYTPSTKTDKKTTPTTDKDVKPLGAAEDTHEHDCEDIDAPKLHELDGRLQNLEKSTTPINQSDLQTLYNDVIAAQNAQDNIHRDANNDHYNRLLLGIKTLAKRNNLSLKDDKGNDIDLSDIPDAKSVSSTQVDDMLKGADVPAEYKNAIPAAWGLNDAQIKELHSLGVKVVDLPYNAPNNQGLSLPTTMSKANLEKLKEIANGKNIPVAMANNPRATIDSWIAGKIGDISEGQDGKVSFEIDCASIGRFGYKYKATNTDGNKYNVDCITTTLSSGHRKSNANGVEYTFGTSGYLERNDEPLIITT